MNRHVNAISNRLSLRQPQRDSLEILARIGEIIPLRKDQSADRCRDIIAQEFPNVSDFERNFPSLCFALATGVGKTRLMGAFVAYLHLAKGVRHFFVLAPNLTIYNKLIADFTPNTPKYVLQGISEFALNPPEIITGDNYESGRGVRRYDLFGDVGIHINVFNISKINSDIRGEGKTGKPPKMKRLHEVIGDSYFHYLSELDDLVLLMDESHRYRASAGVKAINELLPILGLELTATPKTEEAGGTKDFKNVIYSYPLSKALSDGFVKEPVVATRENFQRSSYTDEELNRLKLEDGVRVHEAVKVELEVYSRQNNARLVKPFMLVIAQDTDQANGFMEIVKRDDFFEGRYKERVITVHSGQSGEEKDETVERLLAVESPDEATEIVIHVNMLKEGWDVTNLYTIVPLRAGKSSVLVEQSIGRGLRLPYGKRTGVKAIDRLTIVAHDRFQEIIDDANNPNSIIKSGVYIGRDIAVERKDVFVARPQLDIAIQPTAQEIGGQAAAGQVSQQQAIQFITPMEQTIAQVTLEVIKKYERLPRSGDLKAPNIQAEIVKEVAAAVAPRQKTLEGVETGPDVAQVVAKTTELYVERSIDIPNIVVVPKGEVTAGFRDFELDTKGVRLQPVASEILLQYLRTNEREKLNADGPFTAEKRLEDYLIRRLVDYDDVSYDDHADMLYKLTGQMVQHLQSYLPDADAVTNVLRYHERTLAELIHAQMEQHYDEGQTVYEAKITKGFTRLRENNYTKPAGEDPVNFRAPVEEKQYIRSILFGGFRKCLYQVQKFDSDPERRFAVLLEDEKDVLKWFKPARDQVRIYYSSDSSYEPDFIVETATEKLMCEPKRASELQDDVVQAKARAAVTWCHNATEHARANGGKPWSYLLIPHDAVTASASLMGLTANFKKADL
jgi:type III restriction enzyme